mmetsp:Transcript_16930/g.43766  ORF Transcript_16930/g.43766 Transcript_16930/m.43766 type:complete len:124 (-) Transcript_16930:177-548(-)|eukprot:CAMPEP_0119433612 /NCGR_PEP_ID=MMETSP1335-20130426/49919_1 /TAXON_ID=259385 /ORGANISM="Chrysoculter rhomboideus, Strain RCC1486" /LENGTH=123 /DNA_ID=CAMNT_0007459457 /DNA_START=125 /DNA_END=496 /DNA_ORIENTATION=-
MDPFVYEADALKIDAGLPDETTLPLSSIFGLDRSQLASLQDTKTDPVLGGRDSADLVKFGEAFTSSMHSQLQRSLEEDKQDPFMLQLQAEHPDQYARHQHSVREADMAITTLGALLQALGSQP